MGASQDNPRLRYVAFWVTNHEGDLQYAKRVMIIPNSSSLVANMILIKTGLHFSFLKKSQSKHNCWIFSLAIINTINGVSEIPCRVTLEVNSSINMINSWWVKVQYASRGEILLLIFLLTYFSILQVSLILEHFKQWQEDL